MSDTTDQITEALDAVLPTDKQAKALQLAPGCEMLFGGARGSGGTTFMMMVFAMQERCYGDDVHGLMVARTPAELHNVHYQFVHFFHDDGAIFNAIDYDGVVPGKLSGAGYRFPSGATIRFAMIDDVESASPFIGDEYTFIGVDNLTEHPDSGPYQILLPSLRNVHSILGSIVVTGTPGRPGSDWVKERFISPIGGSVATLPRVFMPATSDDNPHLPDDYRDPSLSAALEGAW